MPITVLGQVRFLCLRVLGYSDGVQVVTGASDGIGREYAIQLAEKGFNILAVARNEAALTAVTDEIGAKHSNLCSILLLTMMRSKLHFWLASADKTRYL